MSIDPIVLAAARTRLIEVARSGALITYSDLARDINYGMGNGLGLLLNEISVDCKARGEWSLSALVVRKDSGTPGDGWSDGVLPWADEAQALYDHWA